MSEMRKFLIYEIPGLLTVIYFSIIIYLFDFCSFKDLIASVSPNQGLIVPVIAYPIGWFEYQFYESFTQVHYKTISFDYICKEYLKNMKKECCHTVVDYILKEDYKEYPELGDGITGFWDHYKARRIAGFLGIIFSVTIFLSALFKSIIIIISLPTQPPLVMLLLILLQSPPLIVVSSIIVPFFIINYFYIYKDADRIKKEVEMREFFWVLKNEDKLKKIQDVYSKENSDCRKYCMDP